MTSAKIDLINPQMKVIIGTLQVAGAGLDWSVGLGASFRRWAGG